MYLISLSSNSFLDSHTPTNGVTTVLEMGTVKVLSLLHSKWVTFVPKSIQKVRYVLKLSFLKRKAHAILVKKLIVCFKSTSSKVEQRKTNITL